MNIKKILIELSKKNKIINKLARKVLNITHHVFFKLVTIGIKTNDKTVIFGAFNGRSYCDSPKSIYEYMLSENEFVNYQFIWIFKNPTEHMNLQDNYHTKVIKSSGIKYYRTLAKSKYWILNYKLEDYIYPKKNQVFVQCWHGTPLKRLGCDLEHFDNALNSLEGMKKRYKKDAQKLSYFLSPSEFATKKFISIWNLKEIGKENCMLELGYPRNDFLYNYNKDNLKKIKEKLKIENISKKIILYAPTYRDNQHASGVGYTYKTEANFEKLQKELSDDYIILFRAHWLIANQFEFEKYKGFIYDVSNYDDINELYVISDILITDYSSVFFDYANLKRPIIFYMYDLEDYRDNIRGFYLDLEELPGNIIKTEEELIKNIKEINSDFYNEKYKKFNQKFNYLDDGKASQRVVNKIFNN